MRPKSGYAGAIIRQWIVIVVLAVVGAGGGALYGVIAPPSYSSSASVLVTLKTSGGTGARLAGSSYLAQVLPTYVAAVTTSKVLIPVEKQLGLHQSLTDLRRKLTVDDATGSSIISISATAKTPRGAQRLAEAVAARFAKTAPHLISPVTPIATPTPSPSANTTTVVDPSEADAPVSLVVIDVAEAQPTSASLRVLVDLLAGLAAGLVIAIVVAVIRHRVDDRLTSAVEIGEVLGVPVLAELPAPGADTETDAQGPLEWQEPLRALRVFLVAPDVTLFVGVRRSSGVSSLVAAFGTALARTGVPTVVVDADLRHPTQHELFGVELEPGFADVVRRETTIFDAIKNAAISPQLTVLSAGVDSDGGDLVASPEASTVIKTAASPATQCVVDTSSLAESADALALARLSSRTVLVVPLRSVTAESLSGFADELARAGGTLTGVVVVAERVRSASAFSRVRAGVRLRATT